MAEYLSNIQLQTNFTTVIEPPDFGREVDDVSGPMLLKHSPGLLKIPAQKWKSATVLQCFDGLYSKLSNDDITNLAI